MENEEDYITKQLVRLKELIQETKEAGRLVWKSIGCGTIPKKEGMEQWLAINQDLKELLEEWDNLRFSEETVNDA